MSDIDDFFESANRSCLDAVTFGNGPEKGNTVIDIGFSNINPVIHVPATILGVSTMENWEKSLEILIKPDILCMHTLSVHQYARFSISSTMKKLR